MAGCSEYNSITHNLGLGAILLNGDHDTYKWWAVVRTVMFGLGKILLIGDQDIFEWQALVSAVMLHRAMNLDRFF